MYRCAEENEQWRNHIWQQRPKSGLGHKIQNLENKTNINILRCISIDRKIQNTHLSRRMAVRPTELTIEFNKRTKAAAFTGSIYYRVNFAIAFTLKKI